MYIFFTHSVPESTQSRLMTGIEWPAKVLQSRHAARLTNVDVSDARERIEAALDEDNDDGDDGDDGDDAESTASAGSGDDGGQVRRKRVMIRSSSVISRAAREAAAKRMGKAAEREAEPVVILYNGFRVSMGCHTDDIRASWDPATERVDYTGRGVEIAARVAAAAWPGEVACEATGGGFWFWFWFWFFFVLFCSNFQLDSQIHKFTKKKKKKKKKKIEQSLVTAETVAAIGDLATMRATPPRPRASDLAMVTLGPPWAPGHGVNVTSVASRELFARHKQWVGGGEHKKKKKCIYI
jgi:hypothetical protein